MKKYLLSVIGAITVIATITMLLCSSMEATPQSKKPVEKFQTWEEFLESGVQIENEETCTRKN